MISIPVWAFVAVVCASAITGFMIAALMDRGDRS